MIFRYSSHEFEQDNIPKCNICGNDLVVKLRKKYKPKRYEYYQILSCTNCELKTKDLKWKSFLPINMYNEIKLMYKNLLTTNHIFNIDNYLKKGYSKDEAKSIISKIQKDRSSKVKNRVVSSNDYLKEKGYSEEQIKNMRVGPNQIKYWERKGYSENDSKNKVSEHQSKVAKGTIRKGTGKYPNQVEYWLKKGYSDEESKKEISKRQMTFSLNKCIEKYGELDGRNRWLDRQEKWMNSYKKSNFSKVSQELFWRVYEKMDKKEKIFFATLKNGIKDDSGKNNEFRLKLDNRVIMPDFIVGNKIIEFDGTYYHRDSPENKKRDMMRDIIIKENGYDIFHVNESEYKKIPGKIINDCFNFLNN